MTTTTKKTYSIDYITREPGAGHKVVNVLPGVPERVARLHFIGAIQDALHAMPIDDLYELSQNLGCERGVYMGDGTCVEKIEVRPEQAPIAPVIRTGGKRVLKTVICRLPGKEAELAGFGGGVMFVGHVIHQRVDPTSGEATLDVIDPVSPRVVWSVKRDQVLFVGDGIVEVAKVFINDEVHPCRNLSNNGVIVSRMTYPGKPKGVEQAQEPSYDEDVCEENLPALPAFQMGERVVVIGHPLLKPGKVGMVRSSYFRSVETGRLVLRVDVEGHVRTCNAQQIRRADGPGGEQ